MTNFQKFLFYSQNLSEEFIKKLCFINNIRSKYLTIFLIICSLAFTFYDISILQKVSENMVFLIHFKTDIIFLVFSFVFALYIYFNQVKTYKNIQKHHRYIHGIISLFILFWSVYKSIILIKYSGSNYHIAAVGLLVTSFLYLFPTMVYMIQVSFTLLFATVVSLIYNFTFNEIIKDILFIFIISCLSIIISRYIFYLQVKILYKESEVNRYKKKINPSN